MHNEPSQLTPNSSAPQPAGEIANALSRLQLSIQELGNQVERHRTLIDPVLKPSQPTASPDGDPVCVAQASNPSQLGCHLNDFIQHIDNVTLGISGMSDRVDL